MSYFTSETFHKFIKEYIEKNRIIHITGAINDEMLDFFRTVMFYLDSLSEEPIKLYINSPGGSVYSLLGMLDVIDNVKSDVYTYVNGLAASAAAILLTYGKKRYATKYSTIMFHQPLTMGISGQTEDILRYAGEMERLRNLLAEIVSQKTGLSKRKILRDLFDRDTYLPSQKAKELGIIDEII
jgi:ATP-dependent Clp protease protease subunit